MRETTPNAMLVIPNGNESERQTVNADRSLSVLNELGRTFVAKTSPRAWDGETISLAGFKVS
jgi:hypothetical protein